MPTCVETQPVLIRSALLDELGVPHAFTTRIGGVSTGVYASLNFGSPGNLPDDQRDSAANVRANWARVHTAIGTTERALVEVHQVHGAEVRVVHAGGPAHVTPDGRDTYADALATDDPARVIAVRVADCCPVLIASRDGRAVAAVHAGWRGVIQAIVPACINAMVADFALRPRDLVAAIGPCIGGGGSGAFEVGPEVAAEFERVFGVGCACVKGIRRGERGEIAGGLFESARPEGKATVDMQDALREQLITHGVTPDAIDVLPYCTVMALHTDAGPLFFSHRRETGVTGRMAGMIGVLTR